MRLRYLARRQNPFAGDTSAEDAEKWLARVAEHFGEAWLESDSGSPLQALWKRRDALATSELLTLGHSIDRLQGHASWLAAQVRIGKGKDRNNAAGAIFEILALGQFDTSDALLKPTKASQAGFDGTLTFRAGGCLTISLKRYGMSKHQAEVNRNTERLRRALARSLRKLASDGLAVVVFADAHPQISDWSQLHDVLSDVRILAAHAERRAGIWTVRAGPVPSDEGRVAEGCGSYILQVLVPFHRNEADNLRDKLLDGCRNLGRHGVLERPLSANVLYVHVPSSASLLDCRTWVEEWFADFPEKPVSAVVLYQPTVARTAENKSLIHHCFQLVRKRGGPLLPGNPAAVPHITIPIGRCGTEPCTEVIVAADGRSMVLRGHYAFQVGDLYLEMAASADGKWTSELTSPAPGVHVHAILPKPLGAGLTAIGPRFPRSEDLLIL